MRFSDTSVTRPLRPRRRWRRAAATERKDEVPPLELLVLKPLAFVFFMHAGRSVGVSFRPAGLPVRRGAARLAALADTVAGVGPLTPHGRLALCRRNAALGRQLRSYFRVRSFLSFFLSYGSTRRRSHRTMCPQIWS